MRVIHIIPSAFEYFEDIRAEAFEVVDELNRQGVQCDAVTLQYGGANYQKKDDQKAVATGAKKPGEIRHEYESTSSVDGAIANFSNFDIVHLHCPFFGSGKKIMAWRAANPQCPLVVSLHHPIPFTDVFSLWVRWYSSYYIRKVFAVADVIISDSKEEFKKNFGESFLSQPVKLAEIRRDGDIHLTREESVVKLRQIYDLLDNQITVNSK